MRVLFLTYSIVGQSNYLRAESLARGLAEGGSEVTLVSAPGVERQSRSFDQEEVGTGVLRQVTVGKRGASRFRNSGLSTYEVIQRRLALAGAKFDLVHTFGHRPTVSWVGPILARRHRVPLVADWCDLYADGGIAHERSLVGRTTIGMLDRWLEPRTYRRADAVSVISRALAERARALKPQLPIATVFPGGLPSTGETSRAEVRRSLGIPSAAPVVVHVSQNHQDVGLLRQALMRTAELRDDVHFLLIGPDFPSVLRQTDVGRMLSRTHCTGPVPHSRVGAFLAAADVALLPYPPSTKNECRFPCSFSEYAGLGLPVVTQPTGDLGQIGGDEPAALMVPADGREMALAIDRILTTPSLAADLSTRGRELAATKLSWSTGVRRLRDLYRSLMSERARSTVAATT